MNKEEKGAPCHKERGARREEIQEIKNTIRRYEVEFGVASPVDSFWEAFNSSRCKTAMLVITIMLTLMFGISVLFNRPNEELTVFMGIALGFWTGRSTKAKDNRIN